MRNNTRLEHENLRLLKGADTRETPVEVVESNRLKALEVLVLALLREVEALGKKTDPGSERGLTLSDEVHRFEADIIRAALARTGGRQRRAARLLGVKVTTLNAKIKRYHIDSDAPAGGASNLRLNNEGNIRLSE